MNEEHQAILSMFRKPMKPYIRGVHHMDENRHYTIESLLAYPPEEIFASFLNDLSSSVLATESWAEILSERDWTLSEEERRETIAELNRQIKVVQKGLAFAKEYLSAFNERKRAGADGRGKTL